MMIDQPDPFHSQPNTLDASKLERAGEPAHRVLSDLIADCSIESTTSTTATAALVLSLWQLRGDKLSEHVPSLILLNAGEAAPDPVDEFVKDLVHNEEATRPGAKGRRAGVPIKPEHAPAIMAQALRERRALGYRRRLDSLSERNALIHEEAYRQASKSGYGVGCSRGYSRAWAEPFGLLTDDDDQVILRLNEASDRAAFRHHVLNAPQHLIMPEGIGRQLLPVRKSISVSGSLTIDLWDEELVTSIIELGLPVVFLPHTAAEPLIVPNAPAMKVLPDPWRSASGPRARTWLDLAADEWFGAHAEDVRRRLHLLPGNGTYEFAILQLLRQLDSACVQIARYAANNSEGGWEHVNPLSYDLHARAFRGVTLGTASLAWHCLGFDPGCPREKAMKALKDLRTKGPMSRSDILRSAHIKKEQRDVLLQRLAAEDLVHIDGRTVTATTFEEFVEALHSRPELPGADNFQKLVADEAETPA